uniref:Tc1-like transposase DDE domain-containing protein n=1 Tax=Agrobacterium albertimagni TaxID=147266 RepID=A0A7C1T939_9HYPH
MLPLPPKSPELNPVENLWLFMRENWLSKRMFKSYDDIVADCCDAWRKPALARHVHRTERMGKWVLISEEPYNWGLAVSVITGFSPRVVSSGAGRRLRPSFAATLSD